MDDAEALSALASMAHPDRLGLLKALVRAEPEGMIAGDLALIIGASPSKTSFHLSSLAKAGLVTSRRQARKVTYRVDFQALGGLVRYILEDCCGSHREVVACCAPCAKSGGCC